MTYLNLFYSFISLFIYLMKVIINEALKRYEDKAEMPSSELQGFVLGHRFYSGSMDLQGVVKVIERGVKKNNQVGSRSQHKEKQYQKTQSSGQLSLYLNKDNNKQIFALFDLITSHPKGITYEMLSKKLKTDIITISHYCCKLKKLRLIYWQHQKQGVIVFPKMEDLHREDREIKYSDVSLGKNETGFDIKDSFLFKELGMNENIWINISSQESVSKGGMTNEEIKRKIMKHAENKMVRRTVESMKYFEKNAERQGKVFQFKYKNETQQIKDEIIRKNEVQEQIEILNQSVQEWLQARFPQFQGQSFLLDLINNKFKDYISSVGVKQSKRQCTPLKLNRYIKVLNYLQKQGGMRQNQLRNIIIKDQKQKDIGTMHKRSLMGILEGLKSLNIIFEEDGYYYPEWAQQEKRFKKKEASLPKKTKQDYEEPPRKRNHLNNSTVKRESKKSNTHKFKKISQKQYKLQLFAALLAVALDKSVKKLQRKAFNRIVYVERKKGLLKYAPQTNVLHLIENYNELSPVSVDYNRTLQSFYRSLDGIVEQQGRREQRVLEAQNELVKFIRKNPIKNTNAIRIKYGKGWKSKFDQLCQKKVLEVYDEQVKMVQVDAFLI